MTKFEGRVAAVTGAGSGIGRALAFELAGRGCHVAVADVDEVGLAGTVAACEGKGVKVTSRRVDVADRAAVFAWADEVADEHGQVNLVFNNAGVALIADVEATTFEDFEWLMGINFWGVVNGTKAFLPHLLASGEGHVVNISSVFGLISVPSQAAYNSAKFAVRGFTEALRIELAGDGAPVTTTTVHPGGIRTNIVRNARVGELAVGMDEAADPDAFARIARTTPERAAAIILGAVEKDRRRVLVGPDAYAIDLLSRLPAGLYQNALAAGRRRAARRTR